MTTDVLYPPTGGSSERRVRPTGFEGPSPRPIMYRRVLTGVFAFLPIFTLVALIVAGLDDPFPWKQLVVLAVFAFAVGHGVTVGYHRLFSHKSFTANRPLKIVLASLGSMALQGSLLGWVADHRRHHRYADRPGDPHSPLWKDEEPLTPAGGLWHSHLGWCFTNQTTSRDYYCKDLIADPDLVRIDRLFLFFTFLTFFLPFAIGYLWIGTLAGAVSCFLWAGIVRIGITHNFTWAINSICHKFGKRPFATKDVSTNVAVLAPFTMGEAYHNNHHAFPRSARHGMLRGQLDSSARMIRWFEQLGWATDVQWPDEKQFDARRA